MRGILICSATRARSEPGPGRWRRTVGLAGSDAAFDHRRVAVPDEGQTGYPITVALSAAGVGVLTPKRRLGNHAMGTPKEWE